MVCSVCVSVRFYMLIFTWYKGTCSRSIEWMIKYDIRQKHCIFRTVAKGGPYLVIFSFLNGDPMAKNCCRRPISLVSWCSSNIFRTNGFSQPFSGKSPNIFPTFSQHCDLKSLCISLSKVRLPFSNEMLRSSLLPGPKGEERDDKPWRLRWL